MPARKPELRKALAILVTAAALAGGSVAIASEKATQVTALRLPKVTLLDAPNGKREAEATKGDSHLPWPILEELDGFIKVKFRDRELWVRPYAVETDKAVRTLDGCGIAVGPTGPKTGGTRGLGENCPQKK